MLYDSYLHFLIPGGTFPGGSTIQFFFSSFQGVFPGHALRFISSFPHSRGYSPGRLYDLNLQFLIPGGTFPGCSTIQFFFSSFQGVFPGHALRSKSSISHSRGYFPGWLYEPNLHFLIPGGISRACSTIHIFFSSFSGVFPWAALRSKSSISHSKGYFPGMLYDSYLLFLIPRDTSPANFFGSLSHSNQ